MNSSSGTSSTSTPPSAPTEEVMPRRRGGRHTGLYVVLAIVVVIAVVLAAGYAAGWFKTSSSSTGSSCAAPAVVPASHPAAGPTPADTPAQGQTITGAGSTLVAPLMFTWATEYTNNTVDYASVGSGAGISDITDKSVDFGASDAPMSPAQFKAVPSPGVYTIPESAGAAVPIYNLPTVGVPLKFTGAILAGIYLGQITNWNNTALQAANPGVTLPNACIIVVHRSDGSGTSFIWTSWLSKENATWKNTVGYATSVTWPAGIGAKGNAGVTQTVKSTVDAIGYVDINYALTNGVAFGAVQNPAGNFIEANLTNIASAVTDSGVTLPSGGNYSAWYNVSVENSPGAHDYPLASYTYVFVYTDLGVAYGSSYTLAHAEALVDFLKWMITTGQTYSSALYYVPLPTATVAADMTTIGSITYNGASIP